MKLSYMLLTACLLVSAASIAQKISLDKNEIPLADALAQIRQQSEYSVLYDESLVRKAQPVSIHINNGSLEDALKQCFSNQPFTYTVNDRTIVVTPRAPKKRSESGLFPVTGKVQDEQGRPLAGVTVASKNGNFSTATGKEGTYSIKLEDASDSLIFTFVGLARQALSVNNRSVIDVTLKQQASGMDDVVVVAYGQQKKVTMIGAISTVNADELKQPVANLTDVIAGRIGGAVGVQRSGQPGYDGADIYVRGISTFTNASPLVLVDGIERDFTNVDPEDIASFSVLKDASATALYGVRGANGVIIIETKKGKVGKPRINLQFDQGLTQFTKIPKFADGVTYMKMANEAYHSSNPSDPLPKYTDARIAATASHKDPDLYPDVDWFKTLFNKYGDNRRARVNASGGSDNAQYYLSVGYYDEKGMYKTDGLNNYNSAIKYTRYNFTSNLTLKVTKTTKVDFGAAGWLSNGNYPGNSVDAIWGSAFLMPPILIPPVYSNGLHSQISSADIFNPYNLLTQSGYSNEFRSQLWSNLRVTQDLGMILKGLSITGLFSFDNYNSHTINRTKTVDGYLAYGRDSSGKLLLNQTSVGSDVLGYTRTNGGTRQFYSEAAINYANNFGKHAVTGMILYNQQDQVNAFLDNFIASIPHRLMGLAGRATYAYDSKYLLEYNFGYNGSETFAPNHRFGYFPSYGAGWVVSDEKFFRPLTDAIPFFKLRYSIGFVGNGNIGDLTVAANRFAYISTIGAGNTQYNNGVYTYGQNGTNQSITGLDIGSYAVDVTWEKSKKQNLGFELKTWGKAISLIADVFREDRTGIFLPRGDVPNNVGLLSNPTANLGIIHNRGIDATLEINKTLDKNWSLAFRGTFTWTKAIVINDANAPWPYPWQQHIGRKYGQRFGYTALGLFTSDKEVVNSPLQTGTNQAGDIKYKDLNGDGKIDSYDEGPIGYGSFPEIVYGFGPTITYKGFSLGGWFKGISDVDISLNGDGFQPFSQGGERGNLLSEITNRWTPANKDPHPFYPRLTYGNDNMNYANSSWWVKNGAFMRLQTLQLNYDFYRTKWLRKTSMSNLSVYFLGYNLWTVSGFKLWDVELGDGKGAQYPLTKTLNIGIKATFK